MTLILAVLIGVSAGAAEDRPVVEEKISHVLEIAWTLGYNAPVLEDLTEAVNDLRKHDGATVFAVLSDAHDRCSKHGGDMITVESLAALLAGRKHEPPGGMRGTTLRAFKGHVLAARHPPGAGGSCGGGIPDFAHRTLRDVVGDDPKIGPPTRPDGPALLKSFLAKDEPIAERLPDRGFQLSLAIALGMSARMDLDLRASLLDAKSPYGPNEYVAHNGQRTLLLALGVLRSRDSVARLTEELLAALPGAEGKILPWDVRHLGQALRLAGGEGLITRLRAGVAATRPLAQRRTFDESVHGEAVACGLLKDLAKEPAAEDVGVLTWVVQADLATPRWKTFVAAMDWAAARIESTKGEERDRARILLHAGHWSFNGHPVIDLDPDEVSGSGQTSIGIGGYPDGLTLHRLFKEDLESGRISLSDEQRGLPDLFAPRIERYDQAWRDPKLRVEAVRDGNRIRVTIHNGESKTLWVNPVAFRNASAWVGLEIKDGKIVFERLDIRLGHIAHNHMKRFPASVLERLPPGGEYVFTYPLEERFSIDGIKVSFRDWSEITGEVPGPVLSSFRDIFVRSPR
jgi:hypothetical protein